MPKAIVFSGHAREAMVARDILDDWILAAVLEPTFAEPDPGHLNRRRFFRRVAERGGRVLRVVCEDRPDALIVVTAHFDRSRRFEKLL